MIMAPSPMNCSMTPRLASGGALDPAMQVAQEGDRGGRAQALGRGG